MTTAPSSAGATSAGEPGQFPLVLGLDTFGDLTHDERDRPDSHAQTIRNVVEQGVLADQAGRRELTVRAMLHSAALGDAGDETAAALLATQIENAELQVLL